MELPDEIKKNIVEMVNELKDDGAAVKWVEANNLHATLKFLGWVEERELENITGLAARAAAGTKSFKVKLEGMGTFPPGKSPRVIWVGITEGGDKLKALANSLEKSFSQAGYREEEREFTSHITVGRVKERKGVDKLKEKMESFKDAKLGEAWVDSISVMKSTLTPKGPVYEKIKEVKL